MSDTMIAAWLLVLGASLRWLPVLALAALAAHLLRRRPARERHAVWLIGLTSLGVLPFSTVLADGRLPSLPVPVPSPLSTVVAPAEERAPSAPGVVDVDSRAVVLGDRRSVGGRAVGAPASGTVAGAAEASEVRSMMPAPGPSTPSEEIWTWPRGLGVGWALIALALLAYEALSVAMMGALGRRSSVLPREFLPADLRDRGPELLSGSTDVPVLCGIWRPRILLPSDWAGWPESWLRAVVLHERAHAERRDVATLAIARCIRAVFWFHPGAWLAARSLRREAERATDERVLAAGLDRFDYADALLGLARRVGQRRALAPGLAVAAPRGIEDRLVRVVGTDPGRIRRASPKAMRAAAGAIAIVSLAAAAPIGSDGPAPEWLHRSSLPRGGAVWQSTCSPDDTPCFELVGNATELLRGMNGGGAVAVQEVATGRVLAYAFLDREGSRPAVPAPPIAAVAGLPLAAAWWDAGMGDRRLPCPAVINLAGAGSFANTNGLDTGRIRAPADVLAMQCATAAIAMAWYLEREVAPSHLRQAFGRWGFASSGRREPFWTIGALPEPAPPIVPAHRGASGATWTLAGSVHGTVRTSPLHLTRFLQAIANGGEMIEPVPPGARLSGRSTRYMETRTAEQLLAALLDVEPRAGGGAGRMVGIVGRTAEGTGGGDEPTARAADEGLARRGDEVFAGLALDERGAPRHAVVVWLPESPAGNGLPGHAASRQLAEQLLTHAR